ncbi:MAG: transposase [Verrucomicrobiae bacterium]|nr:transposase [Verrucomicrobiae bacterium]
MGGRVGCVARQARIEYEGACYHVMARGDRREEIFLCDGDRDLFLATLGEACGRSGMRVLGYVLMANHYHLLVSTPEGNLVAAIRWMRNAYTRRFNARHGLWGHVFGGRYKAVLVDAKVGAYFCAALDYIHLNSVRAGLVRRQDGLESYGWSSLRANGQAPRKRPEWLDVAGGLGAAGLADAAAGRREFLERLERRVDWGRAGDAGLDGPLGLGAALRRGWCFGAEAFRERMLKLVGGRIARRRARRADGYRGGEVRDHGLGRARRLVEAGLEAFGLTSDRLIGARG